MFVRHKIKIIILSNHQKYKIGTPKSSIYPLVTNPNNVQLASAHHSFNHIHQTSIHRKDMGLETQTKNKLDIPAYYCLASLTQP